jgi:CheY-like chemotaxis protein
LDLALLNMAVNAKDAMPGGGLFSISARNVTLNGGEGDAGLAGEFVVLKVQDTGAGIPEDILPRVLEPFFTTKEMGKGTGLGLSQVYGFAEQSGGRVEIASRLGEGTTITLYLPRASREPTAAGVEAQAPKLRSGACILVVEDNPDVAEVTVGLLEQLGNRTRLATSAEAALRALEGPDAPDLVFSDIVMAGDMDGLELARRLKIERPDLPVLLATGYSQSAEQVGDEFAILPKPFTLADLSRAVGVALTSSDQRKLIRFDPSRRRRKDNGDDEGSHSG